jgi:CBS domain-containing protein
MMTVRDVLERKGKEIWSIAPDASVYDAVGLMAEKGIGALLVIEDERLCGIVSERDYARKVVLRGRSSSETQVRDIMTDRVLYVGQERSIEECMALMTEKRVRHLPVMEDDRLVGILSVGDVIKAIVSQQEFIIEQLENYIKGR